MRRLNRDAARAVIRQATGFAVYDKTLDALEECIRPDPAQTIDRIAVENYLNGVWGDLRPINVSMEEWTDRFIALVQSGEARP